MPNDNLLIDPKSSVAYRTALASIKLLREASVIDLTEDDYHFLTRDSLWLPIDRSRARRCIEAGLFLTIAPEYSNACLTYFAQYPVLFGCACFFANSVNFLMSIIFVFNCFFVY